MLKVLWDHWPKYFFLLFVCLFTDLIIKDMYFKYFIYFFRDRERERERERNISVCKIQDCPLHTSNWGPSLQPRYVPWLGIDRQPFGLQAGIQTIHWATPARARILLLILLMLLYSGYILVIFSSSEGKRTRITSVPPSSLFFFLSQCHIGCRIG